MKREGLRAFFSPTMVVVTVVLVCLLGATLLAPLLAPYDPNAVNLSEALEGPSARHLLGTDQTGRDLFSRLLYGGRTTLLGALGIVLFAVIIGVPWGMFAGYYGGFIDTLMLRASDIILSFPSLLLAFVFVAAFGRGLLNSIIAVGIVYIPMTAKLTRSLVLMEKNKTYVEAARSVGYPPRKILFGEILPNCLSTLLAQLTLDLGYAILDLAAMSFVGLGVQPPTSDWGAMLEEGRVMLFSSPMLAVAPGLAIVLTVVAINLFSDGVQSWADPGQRRVPGQKKWRRNWGVARG